MMNFKREIIKDLQKWRSKPTRKPLLIMGARQIGKTTMLKSFGKEMYDNFLYINLEKQTVLHKFFTGDKDPKEILKNLSLIHGQNIIPDKTLIILDEIQECRDALISLKYFQEEAPEIHIIGAGSLLGLSIGNNRSFPVGKVEFLDMYPLTFSEFLAEADKKLYKTYHHFLDSDIISPIPDTFYIPLQQLFKQYILIGGMPEVASRYLEARDISEALVIQDEIVRAYELDFVKHADKTTSTKIQKVWNSLPSQLSKENKKFIYKVIRSGARAREYETAVEWLLQAGLLYKVSRVETGGIPLKAYEDITAFKLYMFETGLLIRLAELDPKTFIDGDQFFTQFKGSIAENFVCQALKKNYGRVPYYWTSDGKAEIDYMIEQDGIVIPIEVKSGAETKAKSLSVYRKRYNPELRIRISNLNLQLTDDLLNIPILYAEHVDKMIEKARQKIKELNTV